VGFSSLYQNKNAVVVCFFGDAAANIGAFHESLNMAAVMKLPVVWVCENNQYGLSTHIKRTLAGESIAARGAAYGIPGVRLDGNDVSAVHAAAQEAVERARSGKGPTLIEADTYRWYGHGASDNRSYRTREEEAAWKEKCPIRRYTAYLLSEKIATEEQVGALEKAAGQEVQEAIKFANESPLPDPAGVMNYIFSS